jgi:hypothetical protein
MTKTYSNSELASFKMCPMQWRFQYDLHLRSIEDESGDHHLRFGAAFHAGLEQLYRGNGMSAAMDAVRAGYPRQLDVSDFAKTLPNALVTLKDYAARWGEEDRKWGVVEIETYSEDEGYNLKPDLIIENLEHGGRYLVDHKTTGSYLNYNYWNQFQPNSQLTYYIDYGQSKYGEIEGFIVNAISFRYRQRASKDGPAGFWNAFERQVFNRNESQLEFERASRAAWVESLERTRESGFYPTNTGACRFCSYKSLCAPGWTWENDRDLIELQFRQVCERRIEGESAGGRCALDLDHEGECAAQVPSENESEFNITVEV